jgi:hypothetical protein
MRFWFQSLPLLDLGIGLDKNFLSMREISHIIVRLQFLLHRRQFLCVFLASAPHFWPSLWTVFEKVLSYPSRIFSSSESWNQGNIPFRSSLTGIDSIRLGTYIYQKERVRGVGLYFSELRMTGGHRNTIPCQWESCKHQLLW